MKAQMAKEEPNEDELEDGPCLSPAIGEDRIVTYVTGKMSEDEHQDFVAHLAKCKHCLQEVVLWRAAEEIVERAEGRPQQKSTHSA